MDVSSITFRKVMSRWLEFWCTLVLYIWAAPLGVLKKSTRSSRCPLPKGSSTSHNEVDENENIYGQRSDNKQILSPAAKLPWAAGKPAKMSEALNEF
jgi:hypothetical protein